MDTTILETGVATGERCLNHARSVRVDDGLNGGIGTGSENKETCDTSSSWSASRSAITTFFGLERTGDNEDSTNDTLDSVSTSERLAPVHSKVGRSPEDVTEPRSEERTDCTSGTQV